MINKLSIKNFKCFTKEDFACANLTVFCGANSVGKSTSIQAILLLAQNVNKGRIKKGKLDLNGEYFSFGALKDLQCHTPTDAQIKMAIDSSALVIDCDANQPGDYSVNVDTTEFQSLPVFEQDFVYLAAERIGPRNSHDYNYDADEFNIGIYGQYAFSQYFKVRGEACHNQALAAVVCKDLIDGDSNTIKVEIAFKEAMKKIAPTFDIKVDSISSLDQVAGSYPSKNRNEIRPMNVGFGMSYIFPIVLAGICIKPGGTLIVENPEVHLHPEAQSNLAQFLSLVAHYGVQVIVETHSDHILNGIRIFAKEQQLKQGDIIIHSVTATNGDRKVKTILLDQDGRFTALEAGFFDQIEKDLLRLF